MLEEGLNFFKEKGEEAGERKGTGIKGISVFCIEDDVEVSRCWATGEEE